MAPTRSVGPLLRTWRTRRRLSQLGLALQADVSARHLSFLETGRAKPSREILLRLATTLDVPLRGQNELLLAAGFAPEFPERSLGDEALGQARRAIELILKSHLPNPALAVDRHWNLVIANDTARALLADINPNLLAPPINVLRLSLHPEGLGPRIANQHQWREHLLSRLRRQIEATADPVLVDLAAELVAYPTSAASISAEDHGAGDFVVPLVLRMPRGVLSFFSTTTMLGTPRDVTLSEVAIESFYPMDEATARALSVIPSAATGPISQPLSPTRNRHE